MLNYKEKFVKQINKYFISGQRNNNMPAMVSKAKFWQLDEYEALAEIKNLWGSDFNKTDESSFHRSWRNTNVHITFDEWSKKDPIEQLRDKQKLEDIVSTSQKEVLNTVKFYDYISTVDFKKPLQNSLKSVQSLPKTSELFAKIFDEDDLIWISHDLQSEENEIRDVKAFADSKKNLRNYQFYSINPFQEDGAKNRKDSNVKTFRHLLLECDNLSKEDQLKVLFSMIDFGIPIKMITSTGNKSLHALVQLSNISSRDQYEEYATDIFNTLNKLEKNLFDSACKNPSRLSRVPFGTRIIDYETRTQNLIYFNPDVQKVDVKTKIEQWVENILGNDKKESKQKELDEITDDEMLSLFKKDDIVKDIWHDGEKNHCLMYVSDGNGHKTLIDKKWRNESKFYEFITQRLQESSGVKVKPKDLKDCSINFKNEIKVPFIGDRTIKRDVVNVFIPGWLGETLKDSSIPSTLNEPLEIFLDNIFGSDIETRNWTLQWMREFMHTFEVITAPVFWEVQGTGKTMLSKAFGEAIGDWIKTPPKKDDIQFNAWQDHTVIIFEESSSGSKRDGKDLGDLLKDWITEKEKTIEAKGKDPVKKTIKSCFIFNANISEQIAPVFIEDNDRRYTIIRNDNAVNLIDLWSREDFNKWDSGEYQKRLIKWIYNLPKDETVNTRKGIDNEWKKQVVELGKNNIEVALEEIVNTFDGWITCGELVELIYKDYGVKTTARANGNILRKLGYETKCKRISSPFGTTIVKKGYEFKNPLPDDEEEAEIIDSKISRI